MFGKLFGKSAQTEIPENAVLVDVRSPSEYANGHARGAENWPLDQLSSIVASKSAIKDQDLVVYCASGARSGVAHSLLSRAGFTKVTNAGGLANVAHLGLE